MSVVQFVPKLMKKKWGHQIKINFQHGGTQGIIMLALDGWDLSKYENREGRKVSYGSGIAGETKGMQFRISMNGPMKMTYAEWRDLVNRVDNQWQNLRAIDGDV